MVRAVLPIAIFWGIVCDSQPAGLIKTLKFGLLSGDQSVLKLRLITFGGPREIITALWVTTAHH